MARSRSKKFNPWKAALSFVSGKQVQHEVGGKVLTFYPCSNRMAFRLEHLTGPIADALVTLFSQGRQDVGTQVETIEDTSGTVNRTTVEGLAPEMASHRDQQRLDAVRTLLAAFTSAENRILLGQLVMDSLAEHFTKEDVEDIQVVEEFLDGWQEKNADDEFERLGGVDTVLFGQFITGVFKANKEALGPLGLDALRAMQQRVKKLQPTVQQEEPSSTDSTGPTSPTPLSSPQPAGTTSSGS